MLRAYKFQRGESLAGKEHRAVFQQTNKKNGRTVTKIHVSGKKRRARPNRHIERSGLFCRTQTAGAKTKTRSTGRTSRVGKTWRRSVCIGFQVRSRRVAG